MLELSKFLRGAALACSMGASLVGCTHRVKPQPPRPPAEQPPVAQLPTQPLRLDMLLRPADGGRLKTNEGKPIDWFQAVQCCGGADGTVLPAGSNTRWPLASESWMDKSHEYGANAFHFRLGPFFGDADNESEWADIGGPIKADGSWNEPFWTKAKDLALYAAKRGSWVEVNLIDTWYCKHAASNWGDQKMPWPQADIDACGITWTATHERFVRKGVSTFDCLGNVIWLTDNEGGEIKGARREWFEQMIRVIRDEEKKSCDVVHMIGTNFPEIGDGPFDYVVTHERQPLTQPLHGKWTLNNEHNPSFGPDQEAAYFAQAREKGLGWALWLAELQGDKVRRIFERFQDVAGGSKAVCFAPPEDDKRWVGGPERDCPNDLREAVAKAKTVVGDPRPAWKACVAGGETNIACMFPTLEALVSSLQDQGYCAGRTRDAITVTSGDPSSSQTLWYELHATAATDGGYTDNPCKKSTWRLVQ